MRIDPQDIVGKQFKRLTVLEYLGRCSAGHEYMCVCSCGSEKRVNRGLLIGGRTGSCGCLHRETSPKNRTKHGDTCRHTRISPSPEWMAWSAMKDRCGRASHPAYKNYGGRGVTVCDRWLESFENFLMDVGRRPGIEYSLDRIDNNGNYEPGNVRWATRKEQCRNVRHNVLLEHDGKIQCVTAWAEEIEISKNLICDRLKRGWSVEKALTTPVNASRSEPRVDVETIKRVRAYRGFGHSIACISKKVGIGVNTVARILNNPEVYKDA